MSAKTPEETSEDVVARFADKARYVVHLEMAYDIVDELASSPERYIESIYKLSRLAAKVLNDVQKRLDEGGLSEEDQSTLEGVRRSLENWALAQEEFIKCLERINKEALRGEVKRFAALAVAPSYRAIRAKQIMERKGAGR